MCCPHNLARFKVLFINRGRIMLQASVDDIRQQYGKSVDEYFREVFKC